MVFSPVTTRPLVLQPTDDSVPAKPNRSEKGPTPLMDQLRRFYVPYAKGGINPTLGGALTKYAMRYYQLKVGHGAIGIFLARIGVIETPECWWCGAQEQTVIHLYTECRRWRRERRKLSRELGQHGISWQPRPERRWLGRLLGIDQRKFDSGGRNWGMYGNGLFPFIIMCNFQFFGRKRKENQNRLGTSGHWRRVLFFLQGIIRCVNKPLPLPLHISVPLLTF